ncbi:hypothetical protein HanRHA438_Chr02g0053071 [Helianthus annuus]|nr:hypothetical protein HanRHA438_Chr02g0053071 [Helianthus annuus]
MHVGSARPSHWNSISSCTVNVNWVILLTRVHCLILIDNNQKIPRKLWFYLSQQCEYICFS